MTNRGHHLRSLTVCACCRCGFSPDELRAAGFNAAELKAHLNVSAKELKEGGYSKSDLKAAGFAMSALGKLFG